MVEVLMFFDLMEFKGYYKISSEGEIISVSRNGTTSHDRIVRQSIGANGYMKVSLRCSGRQFTRNVHRLLAQTFIDNPEGLPCVNHIDGNKINNSLSNLEWASYSRNAKHAYELGLTEPAKGESRSALRSEDVLNIVMHRSNGVSLRGIAEIFEVSPSTVSDIVCGRTWSHLTGIDFKPNKHKGRAPSTGVKGVRNTHNGKFDVFSFIEGKTSYLIRVSSLSEAMRAKNLSDELVEDGLSLKQVVDALRKVFNP